MLQGLGYSFGTAIDMQLVIDILQMLFDSFDADGGFVGNHLV